jgi:hypothetical protein
MRTKILLLLRVYSLQRENVYRAVAQQRQGRIHMQTHIQQGDLINLILFYFFFQNRECKLKINTDIPGYGKSESHFLVSASESLLHYQY